MGINKSRGKLILFSPFWIAWIEFKSFFLCYCVLSLSQLPSLLCMGSFDYLDFELVGPFNTDVKMCLITWSARRYSCMYIVQCVHVYRKETYKTSPPLKKNVTQLCQNSWKNLGIIFVVTNHIAFYELFILWFRILIPWFGKIWNTKVKLGL